MKHAVGEHKMVAIYIRTGVLKFIKTQKERGKNRNKEEYNMLFGFKDIDS